jgi:hypothetical protein
VLNAGLSCNSYRIFPVTEKNSNNCRITLLSSQDFPACSLFYPVWHCSAGNVHFRDKKPISEIKSIRFHIPQLWTCYLSKLKRARAKRLCPSNCNCYILAMQLMEEQAREYSSLLRLNLGICALPTDTYY